MKIDTNLFKTIKERGLLYQTTDEEALEKMLTSGAPISVYEGTDPTVDSLHIGHCAPFCILRRFQKAGHKVVLLMGGATASVGDPSGRLEMRKMLSKEDVEKNTAKIKESLKVFFDFEGENPAVIVNNADWFKEVNFVDFMRDIGVHFNMRKMLSNDIYVERLNEGGLTFFEMSYMLMQAYDFVHLNRTHGCTLQYGGQDQWANIIAGSELQRKLNFVNGTNIKLVGATNPLLMTPEGKKMGKTEKGAIWIDKDKISAYDFYQGVYQTPDSCVEMMYSLFTDIEMDEVKAMVQNDIVAAKKRLSFEVTKFIRGEADAIEASGMSENLFTHGGDDAPVALISADKFPLTICDLLVQTSLAPSKSEARRLVQGGGVTFKGEKISAFDATFESTDIEETGSLLKKGKKGFAKVKLV